MALSSDDLKNMASTVIEHADGPVHVGNGDQINTTPDAPQDGPGTTVINGDNHGGIHQTFHR